MRDCFLFSLPQRHWHLNSQWPRKCLENTGELSFLSPAPCLVLADISTWLKSTHTCRSLSCQPNSSAAFVGCLNIKNIQMRSPQVAWPWSPQNSLEVWKSLFLISWDACRWRTGLKCSVFCLHPLTTSLLITNLFISLRFSWELVCTSPKIPPASYWQRERSQGKAFQIKEHSSDPWLKAARWGASLFLCAILPVLCKISSLPFLSSL